MGIFKKKDLSEQLKKEAISLGLCQQWQDEWHERTDKDELLDKFVKGIDFAIEHDWPSADFIKKEFEKDIRHRHGVFVNERIPEDDKNDTIVLIGECTGELSIGNFDVRDIYIRHGSQLSVHVTDNARVAINIYNHAKVNIQCDKYAKAFVYKHGGEVISNGNVKIRDKTA